VKLLLVAGYTGLFPKGLLNYFAAGKVFEFIALKGLFIAGGKAFVAGACC